MDDNNRNQHPFLAALKMFEAAARSAFDTAAAFWRPWSGRREKQEAAAKQQQSNAPSEQARQPIKRDQEVFLPRAYVEDHLRCAASLNGIAGLSGAPSWNQRLKLTAGVGRFSKKRSPVQSKVSRISRV